MKYDDLQLSIYRGHWIRLRRIGKWICQFSDMIWYVIYVFLTSMLGFNSKTDPFCSYLDILGIKYSQPDVQMTEVISLRMRSESSIVKAFKYHFWIVYFFPTFCIFVELLSLNTHSYKHVIKFKILKVNISQPPRQNYWEKMLGYDQYQKKDIGCQFIFQSDLLLNLNHTFEQNSLVEVQNKSSIFCQIYYDIYWQKLFNRSAYFFFLFLPLRKK